jgi:hypothetical protein
MISAPGDDGGFTGVLVAGVCSRQRAKRRAVQLAGESFIRRIRRAVQASQPYGHPPCGEFLSNKIIITQKLLTNNSLMLRAWSCAKR